GRAAVLDAVGAIQSVVQLTPLASVRAGLGEDHAPLKASSAQPALVAGLDAAVPGGCRAIDRPDVHGVTVPDDPHNASRSQRAVATSGGDADFTTAVDRGQLAGAPPVRGGHGRATGFGDSRSMCGLSAVSVTALTRTSQPACARPWECLLLQVTAVPPWLRRGHLTWSHGQPSTGPRVPRLPAGTDPPRPGRPARLWRLPPGQGPAPRR